MPPEAPSTDETTFVDVDIMLRFLLANGSDPNEVVMKETPDGSTATPTTPWLEWVGSLSRYSGEFGPLAAAHITELLIRAGARIEREYLATEGCFSDLERLVHDEFVAFLGGTKGFSGEERGVREKGRGILLLIKNVRSKAGNV